MAAKKKATKAFKLDIGEVLGHLDRGNHTHFQSLDEEHQKAFEPYVVMRFLSAAADTEDLDLKAYQLQAVNQTVNRHFSVLTKHPELQWKLMAACGIGFKQRHPWIPPGGRTKKTNRTDALLRQALPLASQEEIDLLKRINSPAELLELAEDYGMADNELADLRKELGLGK